MGINGVAPMRINAEALAYWYLRLNGFLTIPNFVLHPDSGSNTRTDIDILGVRFPYRAENSKKPMIDDTPFTEVKDKPFIAITEVKKDVCSLNGPWTNKKAENMQSLLYALGVLAEAEIDTAAQSLYKQGVYVNQQYHISLVCMGESKNKDITDNYPGVPQILWDDILRFIFNRFKTYRREKSEHGQWDETGHALWNIRKQHKRDVSQYVQEVKAVLYG